MRGRDLVHVGTRDGADDFIDAGTEQIDLRGRMCLPGFIDAHTTIWPRWRCPSWASTSPASSARRGAGSDPRLGGGATPDAPLRGHAWMPDSFEERSPRREWLDGSPAIGRCTSSPPTRTTRGSTPRPCAAPASGPKPPIPTPVRSTGCATRRHSHRPRGGGRRDDPDPGRPGPVLGCECPCRTATHPAAGGPWG